MKGAKRLVQAMLTNLKTIFEALTTNKIFSRQTTKTLGKQGSVTHAEVQTTKGIVQPDRTKVPFRAETKKAQYNQLTGFQKLKNSYDFLKHLLMSKGILKLCNVCTIFLRIMKTTHIFEQFLKNILMDLFCVIPLYASSVFLLK